MEFSDVVLKSSAIYDCIASKPFAGSVAVKGNRILAVARQGETLDCIGPDTKVIDCGDKLVMPGLVDAHVHYFMGGMFGSKYVCNDIVNSKSETECVAMIKKFADEHPDLERIIGLGWFPSNWNDAPLPNKRSVDAAIPDRPVYLLSADIHTIWCNSKALEEAGIRADMPVRSGKIGTFEDGELDGMLYEPEAYQPAMNKVMELAPDKMKEIHKEFLQHIAACGITTISEMTANDYNDTTIRNFRIIKDLENEGALTARLHLYTKLAGYTDFSQALEYKKEFNSPKLRMQGIKGFIDGVASTFTALTIEPYSDRPDTCGIGVPLTPRESMQASVTAANAAGFQVRIHCIADGAVRMALDLYEESQRVNNRSDFKNAVEHIESIHPDDIKRFKQLNVIPSMQPMHLLLDADEQVSRMGPDRVKFEWAFKSILDAGGKLAFGTDYPVVDFDPFPTIYAAVTRNNLDGRPASQNPWECLTLEQTLKAYTIEAASTYDREDELGTLEAGKLADIIVIDKNMFDIAPEEILNCSVVMTMFDGQIIFQKDV